MVDWKLIGKDLFLILCTFLGYYLTFLFYSNPEESLTKTKFRQYRNFLRMSILLVFIAPDLPSHYSHHFAVDIVFAILFPFYETIQFIFGTNPLCLILINLLVLKLYSFTKSLCKNKFNPFYFCIYFTFLLMPDIVIFALRDVAQYTVLDSFLYNIIILSTLSIWISISLAGSLYSASGLLLPRDSYFTAGVKNYFKVWNIVIVIEESLIVLIHWFSACWLKEYPLQVISSQNTFINIMVLYVYKYLQAENRPFIHRDANKIADNLSFMLILFSLWRLVPQNEILSPN